MKQGAVFVTRHDIHAGIRPVRPVMVHLARGRQFHRTHNDGTREAESTANDTFRVVGPDGDRREIARLVAFRRGERQHEQIVVVAIGLGNPNLRRGQVRHRQRQPKRFAALNVRARIREVSHRVRGCDPRPAAH